METKNSSNKLKVILHLVLFSMGFILFFSSFKQEKFCPGFDSNDVSEFSYSESDTLIFENENLDVFQVFISEISFSESYTYECRDIYKICPCLNYMEAVATDTKTMLPYSFLRMEQSDVSEMQYFKYNIQGFEFEFDFRNELSHTNEMEHLQYYPSFTIGDAVYSDVVLVTNFDLQTSDISQVYFNKQNGVLSFVERSTTSVWNLKK
ncbi:MAG: hypothetical protein PF450_16560 [Bacteroidales bacterium]|jgi:hypothetical protein|nr:hypothetical protein [Bacteroidales bacterium]